MSKKIDQLAYRVKTFAELTDTSERFIRQEIYAGNLEAIKLGSDWRITAEAARAYLSSKKEKTRDRAEVSEAAA